MQAARGASLNHSDPVDHDPARRRADARLVFAAIAVLAYAADLGSKQWALSALADGDEPLIGDWFTLHLTFNPGAAFSTGTAYTGALSVLSIIAVCVVLWVSRRLGSKLWAVALGMLLAGVAGNLTDRLFRDPGPMRGHVVDFLRFPHWPIFNVADVCINVAAVLIVVQALRGIGVDGRRVTEGEKATGDQTSDEARDD